MNKEQGNISINSENIMPIIKKWLYSDKDIFIRELIANCCDAITKYRKLVSLGETIDDGFVPKITVTIDRDAKTLTFCDNGIGMDADEVKKYINQVAFSGAKDFIEKYETSAEDAIIGHFGLGFYSAFMVAKKAEILTRSYKRDAQAVLWESDGETQFTLSDAQKDSQGTEIKLFLGEEEFEYLEYAKVETVIQKYCAFLPYEIYLVDPQRDAERAEAAAKAKADKAEKADSDETGEELEVDDTIEIPTPINNTLPLWLKNASDCSEQEYKDFYHKVFNTYEDPIFWIHLNVDYPFSLKGILYFPHYNREFDTLEGQIKLYNNQVFVADNVKEVIPEFMMLLRGVIDCPDLPLNVSRSFLQNDGTVRKLQAHITKKVAEKLKNLFNNQREDYEKFWPDVNPFIKFGAIKDEGFYDQIKDILIFEKLDKSIWTLEEVSEHAKNNGGKIYYVSNRRAQAFYIELFEKENQEAILMDTPIDNHFVSFLEYKNPNISFGRIDSEIAQAIKGEYVDMPDETQLQELMKKATGKQEMTIQVAPLKSKELPAMLVVDESMRRMFEMSMRYADNKDAPFEVPSTLVLNSSNVTVKAMPKMQEETAELVAAYVYELALLTQGMLKADDVKNMVAHSNALLEMITGQEEK